MSEFSESYHLQCVDQNEGVALLKRAGLSGFVFPSNNSWITILAEDCDYELNKSLVRANRGLMLHYVFAEDHGWGFAVVLDDQIKCRYDCFWEDDIRTDNSRLDIDIVRPLITPEPAVPVDTFSLHRFFAGPRSIDDLVGLPEPQAFTFAKLLGLTRYTWLSHNYVCDDFDPDQPDFEDVIEVLDGQS
jgi:hypothetical protein